MVSPGLACADRQMFTPHGNSGGTTGPSSFGGTPAKIVSRKRKLVIRSGGLFDRTAESTSPLFVMPARMKSSPTGAMRTAPGG